MRRINVYNSLGKKVGDCDTCDEAQRIIDQSNGYAIWIGNRVQQLPYKLRVKGNDPHGETL
jgi:hypothetical protein